MWLYLPVDAVDADGKYTMGVDWTSPTVSITVSEPSGPNKSAYDRIIEFDTVRRRRTYRTLEEILSSDIAFYKGFLRDHAASVYARDARVELSGLLGALIQRLSPPPGQWPRTTSPADQQRIADTRRELADVLETVTTEGGAYARLSLPRLVDVYLDFREQWATKKAQQAVNHWLALDADNAKALEKKALIDRCLQQSASSTRAGG